MSVFDPNQHAVSTGSAGQLPVSGKDGWLVIITDSCVKGTADQMGSYLELVLEIQSGDHAGETGAYRLNIENANADAVRIALSQLSSICHVVNYLQAFDLTDVSCLHNRPFRVVVGLQKGAGGTEKGYTEVKYVLDVAGNRPGQQKAAVAPAQVAPAPPVAPPMPPVPPQPQVAQPMPGESPNPAAAPWAGVPPTA